MLPDFTGNHVRDLNDSAVLPVIGTRADISKTSPPDPGERSTNGCPVGLNRLRLVAGKVDVQDLPRNNVIRTAQNQTDDSVANAIRTARPACVLITPRCFVHNSDMSRKSD